MENQSCTGYNTNISLGVNLAVHVLTLFTILALFFMLYVAPMMKQKFNSEVRRNINKFVDFEMQNVPVEEKKILRNIMNSEEVNRIKNIYAKSNKITETQNNCLYTTIIMTNVLLFVAVSITIIFLYIYHKNDDCLPLKDIFAENGITFLIVGLVEYLFFTKVALHYVPAKPSEMASMFLESIKQHL